MKGRVHYYEGYTMQQVAFPVRVLKALGCRTLVVTNACGGMNPDMPAGTIVVTTDHINLMGDNPLIGPNDDELGPRFPDMSEPYSRALVALAETVALELKIPLQRGVFVAVPGPNLETRGRVPVPARDRRRHRGHVARAREPRGRARRASACWRSTWSPTRACRTRCTRWTSPAVLAVAGRTAPALTRLVTEVVRRLEEADSKR